MGGAMWNYRAAARLPLAKALAQHGLKLTRPRLAIVQVLSEGASHLSAQEIWEAARALYQPLGRATAFRTLNQMAELGVVRPLYLGSSELRYMLVEGGHHHHMVCMQCGAVVELPGCPLTSLAEEAVVATGFEITGHLVEFFGVCHECHS